MPFTRFSLTEVLFHLQAEEDFTLPSYKGSMLRGAFGYAFRRAVCIARQQKECRGCILAANCAYSYIFETPRPASSRIMRKYEKVPHPFILRPPAGNGRIIEAGDKIIFGLVLVGKARDFLPYFVLTIQELAARGLGRDRGRCRLTGVFDAAGRQIYAPGCEELAPAEIRTGAEITAAAGPVPERLTMIFETPLRLVYNRRIVRDQLTFQIVLRSLLRRLALLQQFHCDLAPEIDFRGLIDRAAKIETIADETRWRELRRYSTRQRKTISTSGLTGALTFAGDFAEFWPLLQLGTYVNLGKNTSFGLGRYRLETEK
jgi:hypothetical protein